MPYADKLQQQEYQRCWMQRRRDAYFADKICAECGVAERLELHHIDPAQKVSHRIWSWSVTKRFEELQKCIVLCHDCHMCKTIQQLEKPMTHGTDRGYNSGCRCVECRLFKSIKNSKRIR